MRLDDFIEKFKELSLEELNEDQLKEVNGGIGGPAADKASWKQEAAFLYLLYEEGCYTC